MERIYGIKEAQYGIFKRGLDWQVYYGHGTDKIGDYTNRKIYDHKPGSDELKTDIYALIDGCVQETILSGLTYQGEKVWLSAENQQNYTALAMALIGGSTEMLPIKVKLGSVDAPTMVVFDTKDDYLSFYYAVVGFIRDTVAEGWVEKDNIDWNKYELD